MASDQAQDWPGKLPVSDILDRLRGAYGAATETELARILGVPQTTLSSWKSRHSIPLSVLIFRAAELDISLDWLIFGRDSAQDKFGFTGGINVTILGYAMRAGLPRRALVQNEIQDVANGIGYIYNSFNTILRVAIEKQRLTQDEAMDLVRDAAEKFRQDFFKPKG